MQLLLHLFNKKSFSLDMLNYLFAVIRPVIRVLGQRLNTQRECA